MKISKILKKISFICFRTACTSKADSDLPRYGKRMQLDERELRRHPHGTIQVVTSATPKLTQINVEVRNEFEDFRYR